MKTAITTFLILLAVLGPLRADPKSEIESLIAYVGGLENASFIRNGGSHSAKDAEAHLRMKRDRAGDRVETAEDFIKLCATQSYLTGTTYKIRFKDGTEKACGELLKKRLKTLRAKQ